MSMNEEQRGEDRHRRTLDQVRVRRLARMTDEERAEFEATYRQERQRLKRTAQT